MSSGSKYAPVHSLSELVGITDGFLAFAASLGRQLLSSERSLFRWILNSWEKAHIQRACECLAEDDLPFITHRIARLRDIFQPDPIKRVRVKCDRNDLHGKKNEVNHKIVIPALLGVKIRKMTDEEATERLQYLEKTLRSMHYVATELSLYAGSLRGFPLIVEFRDFDKICAKLIESLDPHSNQPPPEADKPDLIPILHDPEKS